MARLNALGVLGLTEQKRVARVDLAEAGYEGEVFVCDLSTTQQQALMAPKGGKARIYKDQSMDVDMSNLASDAGARFLVACLVTDEQDGALLEQAFEVTQEPYVVMPRSSLRWLADEWRKELRNEAAVRQRLEEMPSAVTQLIVRTVRKISGVGEDVEEKKAD